MRFPAERQAKRRVLMEAVARATPLLAANAAEAEARGTLPPASVAALYESGLLALKLPAELGGAEADPVTQMEVIEAVARVDASAGWCLMVGATTIGLPAAFLPDEAVKEMFAGGHVPRAAGVIAPTGVATPVPGGYRVTGRWSFASGIRHADWVGAGVLVAGEPPGARLEDHGPDRRGAVAPNPGGRQPRDERPGGGAEARVGPDARAGRDDRPAPGAHLMAYLPVAAVTVHDNWDVAGLQGTGSCDFSVTDVLVSERFTWELAAASPRRGGRVFHLGMPGFVANEHAAFALGAGRRALDEVVALARSKRRGTVRRTLLGDRAVFQRAVASCDLRLRAARALGMETFEQAWQVVEAGGVPDASAQAAMRAAAVLATEVGVDVALQAFRHAGGGALFRDGVLQRCLRDVNAGAQHFMVSDSAYEAHGRALLGLPDLDPMA